MSGGKELVLLIKETSGFQGYLDFDTTKLDGTMVKFLNVSRLKNIGWQAKIPLEDGVPKTYTWFKTYFMNKGGYPHDVSCDVG